VTTPTHTSEFVRGAGTEADAIATIALEGATPSELDATRTYGITVPNGADYQVLDLEHLLDNPRRKRGRVSLHDGESFSAYVVKHKVDGATTLYADVTTQKIVGVLDDAASDKAGWRGHVASLDLKRTDAWQAWARRDNNLMRQVEFAEHIEDNLADIVEPDGATMLEIAQTFQAHTNVRFESSRLLSSGQRQFVYVEDTAATAGSKGDIEVPKELTLGLAPFEVGEAYKVTARIRYRLSSGDLLLGYKLDRPEDILRQAFADVVKEVQARTGQDVMYGTPPV
jgi:uncharacterized protein YfdQ (DUF2303 family)